MNKRLTVVGRCYAGLALTLMNVALAFVLINFIAVLGLAAIEQLLPRSNVVADKYGGEQASLYPKMSQSEIDQLLRETWGRRNQFQPYTMYREPESKGRFVNVHQAGFRVSKNQGPWPPVDANYNVFLFGGSTTFSYGLPDDESLASYLQPLMPSTNGRHVRVYNFGTGGFQSTQERILFQELLAGGLRPDIAIFVDGLNEFAFPRDPLGTNELRRMLDDAPVQRFTYLGSALVARLPVVRLVERLGVRGSKVEGRTPGAASSSEEVSDVEELLDSVIGRYVSNTQQSEAIAHKFGISVAFVWQPIPYYKYDKRYHPFHSEANRYAEVGYRRFREKFPIGLGSHFYWCADIQEELKEPLYLDAAHYTAKMSELLARRIANALSDRTKGECAP